MTIEMIGDGGFAITGKQDTALYRLLALKGRLGLELKGLKSQQSTYALVKREFGFKGSRKKVFDLFCAYIDTVKAKRIRSPQLEKYWLEIKSDDDISVERTPEGEHKYWLYIGDLGFGYNKKDDMDSDMKHVLQHIESMKEEGAG